jgi:phage tail sheath protein FI
MSVVGLIGTVPQAQAAIAASGTFGIGNSGLTVAAQTEGAAGNNISLALVNPAANSEAIAVTVTNYAIVVSLATDAGGEITSTATDVLDAIEGDAGADVIVAVGYASGGDGSEVMAAKAATKLTGGLDEPFPLNTPVFMYSDDAMKLGYLGEEGTLLDALQLVNNQLGEFQVAAKVVVVRVAEGVDADATIANIVGNQINTGLSAFLTAGTDLGVIPRLLMAPGYTSQQSTPQFANPVCAALPAICEKLLAHAVVDGPATTEQAAIDWRETISSDRLIPVDPAVKVLDDGMIVVQPASPAIIGIGVRRDHEKQGRPFHSWANQPIQGILGPSRSIGFSLTDGATEGQRLLAANVGVILRGEMGVESAIASGGYVYVGTDNAGEDDLWRFYNVTRGRDYIHLMLLRTLRFYLGRFNITGQTIQAVLNTMDSGMRSLKADGDILGFEIKFTRDQNSPEELRQGRFTVNFAAEEAPVLRYLGIQSARYRPALDTLLDDLLAQIGTITG